ncbi:hypothetical protein TNCV_4798301 [Trichonephila clavipes]|nr:hypothetical protein TNCV_4798301 [Trichonephila clavipes]
MHCFKFDHVSGDLRLILEILQVVTKRQCLNEELLWRTVGKLEAGLSQTEGWPDQKDVSMCPETYCVFLLRNQFQETGIICEKQDTPKPSKARMTAAWF